MGDLEVFTIGIAALIGTIITSYLGYLNEKKLDPTLEFDWTCYIDSLIRGLPGIFLAAGVGIFLGADFKILSPSAIFMLLLQAFILGTASDVVIKRTWRAIKK